MVQLLYYLSSDQFEVMATKTRNSGRDSMSKLLKKTKIPKAGEADAISSMDNTILQDGVPVETYRWDDLYIGLQIQAASVIIQLLDADPSTREFYRVRGITLGPPILLPKVESTILPGDDLSQSLSEERSVGLAPIEVKKDGQKLKMYAGVILRYLARIDDPKPEDVERRFIVQAHLEDDTIQIREPAVRNSGFWGGIFLQRGMVLNTGKPGYVLPTDIFLGKTLIIMGFKFRIYEADEFTLKYMENHNYKWSTCNLGMIKDKLMYKDAVISRMLLTIRDLTTREVSQSELCDLLMDPKLALGLELQEVVTLFRSIDHETQRGGKILLSSLFSLVSGIRKSKPQR